MPGARHMLGGGADGDYKLTVAGKECSSDIAQMLHDRNTLRGNVIVCWFGCVN